jgi:hypothetical protein
MLEVGLKLTIQGFERAKTFYVLDRAASIIGLHDSNSCIELDHSYRSTMAPRLLSL